MQAKAIYYYIWSAYNFCGTHNVYDFMPMASILHKIGYPVIYVENKKELYYYSDIKNWVHYTKIINFWLVFEEETKITSSTQMHQTILSALLRRLNPCYHDVLIIWCMMIWRTLPGPLCPNIFWWSNFVLLLLTAASLHFLPFYLLHWCKLGPQYLSLWTITWNLSTSIYLLFS